MNWQPIETAPKSGKAFLAYGKHDIYANPPRGVEDGDHWWAIILWDVWRKPQWVFSKDGYPTWSNPTHWMPLPEPPK